MNVLITGGAGFIGSHLADAFLKAGHQVTILDNLSSGFQENISSEVNFVYLDIRDRTPLVDLFKKMQFDLVVHCAAQIDLRASLDDPFTDLEINVIGTLNLLEACRQSRCRRFVFTSTGGAIYGETDIIPTPENHPENGTSPYAISKLACEKYIASYDHRFGIKGLCFRFSNVFGPRQNGKGEAGVIAIFADRLKRGEPLIIFGDGQSTRDYIYIEDVVEAMMTAIQKNISGTFNIATGIETSVNHIAEKMVNLWPGGGRIEHKEAFPGEQKRSVLSFQKAKQAFGFQPNWTIENALKHYLSALHATA